MGMKHTDTDWSLNPPALSLHHFLHGSSTFHHKYLYNWISMQQSKARLDVPARCGNVASSQTKSVVVSDQMAMTGEAGPLLNTWLYAVTQTKGKVAILVVIVVSRENLLPLRRCCQMKIINPLRVFDSSQTAPCFLCYFSLHQMLRTSFWGIIVVHSLTFFCFCFFSRVVKWISSDVITTLM